MSKSVEVKFTSELLTRIAKESPKDALKELIWNSCDADDISLKNVLKEYIKSMDREELIPVIPEEAKEDLTRIPDICLWQQYPVDRDEYVENLIIELKLPTCLLSKKELDQIEDYAFKISKSKVFPKDKTRWNFLLIAKDYDEYVQFKLKDIDKSNKGNFIIRIVETLLF